MLITLQCEPKLRIKICFAFLLLIPHRLSPAKALINSATVAEPVEARTGKSIGFHEKAKLNILTTMVLAEQIRQVMMAANLE